MKRMKAALLIMDCILMGVLFFAWKNSDETVPGAAKQVSGTQITVDAEAYETEGNVEDGKKRIALTFDDGPHPRYTRQLLDGLKERGVQATFFVTGEHARKYPELIERMKEEGHLIGNHTYSHVQLRKENSELFEQELVRTNRVLQEITGEDILYVRPPYGTWDRTLEEKLNMFPVLWDVDPMDWKVLNTERVRERVVKNVQENDIILLHDYYATSVEAALEIVDDLQQEGYVFVTVEEVLFD